MQNYTFDTIDRHIEDVASKAGKLQDKIHALGCSILAEWARDAKQGTECAKKMTALQNASKYHAKAFADWVAVKSGMQWSEEGENWYVHVDQKFSKTALDAAKAEPFWKVSPPQKAKPLTDEAILGMLESILKKQQQHEKKPREGDHFSKAGNEGIRQAIEAIKGVVKA